ncbi:hypothetical protein ACQP00_40995 [Dactylosporangium sp. CS-047395]|uniref:hypothetical protein n=1 Tax=Dactylosporangium sp. CS-047395 TaxID=3239936 RepID=UPI003D8B7474
MTDAPDEYSSELINVIDVPFLDLTELTRTSPMLARALEFVLADVMSGHDPVAGFQSAI